MPGPAQRSSSTHPGRLRRLLCGALLAALLIAGLPLANFCFPDVMATRVLGLTVTWLLAGVLFGPATVLAAWLLARLWREAPSPESEEGSHQT